MASNYYPMVSSSPPPLDDGPSFDEDDDDGDYEFGNFTSADMCTDTVAKSVDPVRETLSQRVSDVDRDSPGNIEESGLETSEKFSSSDHPVSGSDAVMQAYSTEQQPQHPQGNFGDGDSFEDGETIEKSRVTKVQMWDQPISDTCDVGPSAFVAPVSNPSSQEEEEEEEDGRSMEILCGEGEAPVAEQVGTEEIVSEIRFYNPSNVFLASDNEDASTETEVVGDSCLNKDSWNIQVDESDTRRDDASSKRQVDGAATPLEDTEPGAVLPFAPTDSPKDVGDWEHSDSSFDEFTDFQTAPVSYFHDARSASNGTRDCDQGDVDVGDEFNDFATFDEDEGRALECEVGAAASNSFFVDEEFGNFNCACSDQFTEVADAHAQTTVSALLSSAFPSSVAVDRSTVSVIHLDEVLRCTGICDDPKTLKSLWSHLHDIDNTHALTYHWSHSQSNKKLLHSLRIDARNFLAGTRWNSSMPLFAATLGSDPLEPKKAMLPSGDEECAKSLMACDLSTLKLGGTQETAVPPAQFDWGSSGLINPLDDSTSCTLLDLDFFLTNDIYSTRTSSLHVNSLESEFLGSTSSSEGKLTVANGTNAGSSLLVDKILSQAAKSSSATFFNAHAPRRASNLSQEATRILDTLPDLSFMRAKVLMFPIRGAL